MNNENKLYEKVLEISKVKIGDLSWSNILFEANLDIKEETDEADSNKVSLLQDQLQELTTETEDKIKALDTQVESLSVQNSDLLTENESFSVENSDLNKENKSLVQLNVGLEEQHARYTEQRDTLNLRIKNMTEDHATEIQKLIESHKNEKDSLSQLNSETLALNEDFTQQKTELENIINSGKQEISDLKAVVEKQNNIRENIELLQTELNQKEEGFTRIQTKLKDSNDTISKLTQEKGDIESALATQRNLYNELRSKFESVEEPFAVDEKVSVQDEGVLESATL